MTKIEFNEKRIAEICDIRDLMKLVEGITTSNRFEQLSKILVNDVLVEPGVNDLMERVQIKFQGWREKESGTGQNWLFVLHRAKNFSCSNADFTCLTPTREIDKLHIRNLYGYTYKEILKMHDSVMAINAKRTNDPDNAMAPEEIAEWQKLEEKLFKEIF